MITRIKVVASSIHPNNRINIFTPIRNNNGETSNPTRYPAIISGIFSEATM